jgi:glycogen debranching enzyme
MTYATEPVLAVDPRQLPAFDVRHIPFSARGAWLDLSPVVALHTTSDTVHLVSHRNGMHAVLALVPERDAMALEGSWQAAPEILRWTGDAFILEAAFAGRRVVRLRGNGAGMRLVDAANGLTSFTGNFLFLDPMDGAAVFTSYETGRRYRVRSLRGSIELVGDGALGATTRSVLLGGDGDAWEATVEESTSSAAFLDDARTFDDVVADSRSAFTEYLDAIAPWRDETTPAAALAAYVLWSATVEPEGFVTRESILMSKHWMDKVWSWDHCFNALALAPGLPGEALDQFLAPFDHQDPQGALPDSITHSEVLYNFVKPPIHGWALRRLRQTRATELTRDELELVYDRLARWSMFWLDHRRSAGHALPHYQHGNDSGWDNSTTFDRDRVVESPDLAAFLLIQLEVLADLAAELGRDGQSWDDQQRHLTDALLRDLWTGTEFVAVGALTGRTSTASSLLNLLPLVLGDRLPEEVREALVGRVTAHLTEHGPATEPVASQHYDPDGYWRGPIWAPSTALIEDGLRTSGHPDLADSVSERFRTLCERSGFAENFDALTGEGLRDRAYTWTAAVYLTLAADHVARTS